MKNWSGGRQKQRRARNKSAREIALEVLYHVDTRKAFADLQLNRFLKRKELQPRDAALATEIVFGTVRWRMRLDWVLGVHVRDGLDSLNPWIRNILRMAVYQLYFLDRVPAHAIVDESVKLAKKFGNPGMAGLVNAVLRRILREGDSSNPEEKLDDPLEGMAVAYSHPEWLVSRWLERFGDEEVRELLQANNQAPGISLRVHAGKTDREILRQ
ncbi:MAG: 16S rRNA (cytosine(967)-C(5))-methyltransferase RsmB, partial [Candidatus Eisenbacteria bacterium]|nr:16S rRNA (cytosine(967)-C(5))-methyltransferase RsmB [Candidatus Eisenbacteria bacterium]